MPDSFTEAIRSLTPTQRAVLLWGLLASDCGCEGCYRWLRAAFMAQGWPEADGETCAGVR